MLNAQISLLKSPINPQLDHERLGLQFFLASDLLRAFSKDMVQTLFESLSLDALPILVVLTAQEDSVFTRDNCGALWQRYHLSLHHFFDGARDLDDEFFRGTPRFDLRVSRSFLKNELRRLTVDPSSDFVQYAQLILLP